MAVSEQINHDWCGWDERYGRYTHSPSGDTLVCQGWMRQKDWDKAQLEYLQKYPQVEVFNNKGESWGTTDTICAKLTEKLNT